MDHGRPFRAWTVRCRTRDGHRAGEAIQRLLICLRRASKPLGFGTIGRTLGPIAVTLRTAGDADVPAITALVNAAFAVERRFRDRDRTNVDEIAAMLGNGTFLVVDGDDGALLASVYLEQRGPRAYLGMLSIRPSQQGRGLGRAMMAAAEAHAREWGCAAIDIRIVNLRTDLPPFYRALGFTETGRGGNVDDPFATEPYNLILMTKAL